MIKFINADEVLPLRSSCLRKGVDPELCRFEGDDAFGSFHLGYFIESTLVCIASFHKQNRPEFPGTGYQLRGMATSTEQQGKGIGNKVLNFSIVYLRGQKVNYIWCNARKIAYRFYLGIGFEFISPEFEIKDVGTHRTMYLKISQAINLL